MRTHHRIIAFVALLCAGLAVPLARSAGGAPGGGLPPEKIVLTERIESAQRDAFAAPHAAKELAVPLVGTAPEPAWLTGIIDSGQAPLPGSLYEIVNQWQDVVNGEHVNVYAGGERERPDAGLVVVDPTGLDLTTSPGGVYPTPERTGPVRIVEAVGTRLVLVSATGAQFVFDVATRAYL